MKDFYIIEELKSKRLRIYKKCMCVAFVCLSIGIGVLGYIDLYHKVPSVLRVKSGEEVELELDFPLSWRMILSDEDSSKLEEGTVNNYFGDENFLRETEDVDQVSVKGKSNVPKNASDDIPYQIESGYSTSSYIQVNLFGILPFKEVEIQMVDETSLTPMGIPIGIYVKSEGILVVGVGEFDGKNGEEHAPAKGLLEVGDYILKFNGEEIDSKLDFVEKVEESGGDAITLNIKREDEVLETVLVPQQNESGKYKLGIWLRDNAQGVGTLTYIDADGNFGALGHGINDADTSDLFELKDGTLYETEIISIKKGKEGEPGEVTGMICYTSDYVMGDVDENSNQGIFGTCNDKALSKVTCEAMPIGYKQEIEFGEAYVYCTIGRIPSFYKINITGLYMDHENLNRGIELEITDPELLQVTGGIVQGMSGSPIIQNGKIVGAITHVLVSDPTKGYGIFIEEMLTESGN